MLIYPAPSPHRGCHCVRVCPSVGECQSLRLWRLLKETIGLRCLSPGNSVHLSLWVSALPLRFFRLCLSPRVCPSVTGIRLGSRVSRSRLLGRETVEVASRGGGEGRGRRQWEGAGAPCGPEWVCAGGRRRRLSDSAQPALGNLGRLQPPARHGAARPGLAASGESPAPPGTFPRPVAYYASGGRCTPEGSKPPNRTPAAPPGLPSDALHRPTLILNSSLAAADFRSPAWEPAPRRAGRRLCSRLPVGTPEPPFPPLVPKSGATGRCPLLGAEPGLRRFLEPSRAHLIPQPQRPGAAPSQSPLPGPGVSFPQGLRLYLGARGGSAEALSYN